MADAVAERFLANQHRKLREIHTRMAWAIRQLSDEDVNWRPNEQSNSIANLVVHICGNVTQRYTVGIAGGSRSTWARCST